MDRPDLSALVEQIHRTAGFNLHHWACNTPQLNDYDDGITRDDNHTYFRATRGMRDPPRGYNWDGHPVGNFFRWDCYVVPDFTRMADSEEKYVGVLHHPIGSERKQTVEFPEGYNEWDYAEAKTDWRTGVCTKEIPRKGFLGMLGLTQKVKLPPKKTIVWEELPLLSRYVNTECNEPAHLLVLSVPGCFPDGSGRSGRQPQVTIFATEQLVSSIEQYLQDHPQKYSDFLRELFSAAEFPNVNKNMLSHLYEYTEIWFADSTSLSSVWKNNNHPREGEVYEYATKRVRVK